VFQASPVTADTYQWSQYDTTKFVEILFGGDQLTVARANGIKALRSGHDIAFDRLDGFVPVLEHARVILLQVCVSCMIVY